MSVRLVIGLVVASLVATAAGPARASQGGTFTEQSLALVFQISGPNGEQISVSGARNHVTLTAELGRTAISLFAKGSVGPRHVRGDLGRFGSVDVSFDPRGRSTFHGAPRPCRGGTTVRPGTFEGTVEFLGDAGYPAASASQATGNLIRTEIRCDYDHGPVRPPNSGHRHKATLLVADNGTDSTVGNVDFWAIQQDGKRHASFYADEVSRDGSIWIFRSAYFNAASDRFSYDLRTPEAVVNPPAPFSGTAALTGAGDDSSWTGDLAVTFPGQEPVALTGPGFHAEVGRGVLLILREAARAIRQRVQLK